jgi:hypothetical protein
MMRLRRSLLLVGVPTGCEVPVGVGAGGGVGSGKGASTGRDVVPDPHVQQSHSTRPQSMTRFSRLRAQRSGGMVPTRLLPF